MSKNETALEMCLRMLKERAEFFNLVKMNMRQEWVLGYATAAVLLEYALQDNIECLRQFDYYHEDKEEE